MITRQIYTYMLYVFVPTENVTPIDYQVTRGACPPAFRNEKKIGRASSRNIDKTDASI